MDYEQAKARADELHRLTGEAGAALNAFIDQYPKGPFGLTPDNVKAMPEHQQLKAAYDRAFEAQRSFNAMFVKNFAKERKADRAARFAQG